MVESLRLLPGGPVSRIKIAETLQGHPVHIDIHRLYIIQQQRPDEIIIAAVVLREPVPYHALEHQPDFPVRQRQGVIVPARLHRKFRILHFQVPAGQQEAPDGILFPVHLVVYNLLVYLHPNRLTLHQALKILLYLPAALPNQLPRKAVGTGICPVGAKLPCLQIIQDRPWIIDVPLFSECESVIPLLHLILPLRHSIFSQCGEYFFFRKAKTVCILLRCRCHYRQIVQV